MPTRKIWICLLGYQFIVITCTRICLFPSLWRQKTDATSLHHVGVYFFNSGGRKGVFGGIFLGSHNGTKQLPKQSAYRFQKIPRFLVWEIFSISYIIWIGRTVVFNTSLSTDLLPKNHSLNRSESIIIVK